MKQTLQKISSQTDFIIVLSQLSPDENTKLLHLFPDIDLIIQTYGNKITNPPAATPHGIIASPGHLVGLITLERSDDGKLSMKRHEFFPVLDIPEDEKAHEIIMEYLNNIE